MPQTPGMPDHAAKKSQGNPLAKFLSEARKAWVGFLVAGGAAAIAQNVSTLDFSNLGLHNLVQGLVGGSVTGFVVYWVRNELQHFDSSIPNPPPSQSYQKSGGYVSSGETTTLIPRVPPGPGPGGRRPDLPPGPQTPLEPG